MMESMAKAQIKLEVRLTPRASRDEIGGRREGVLQVSPPRAGGVWACGRRGPYR
jgi:uncharacterized protein YggU (UPF0235/DUF167 family)